MSSNNQRSHRKWEDSQIRWLLANRHLLDDSAQALATAHNLHFPNEEQVTARQARSIVYRYREDERFNAQNNVDNVPAGVVAGAVVGAGAGAGAMTSTPSQGTVTAGTERSRPERVGPVTRARSLTAARRRNSPGINYNDDDDDDDDDVDVLAASTDPPVPGPRIPRSSLDNSEAFPPRGRSFISGPPAGPPSQPPPTYQQAADLGLQQYLLAIAAENPAFQPAQPQPIRPIVEINGIGYHDGHHEDCRIHGLHRHNTNGEVIFPSPAHYDQVVTEHGAIAVRVGFNNGQAQGARELWQALHQGLLLPPAPVDPHVPADVDLALGPTEQQLAMYGQAGPVSATPAPGPHHGNRRPNLSPGQLQLHLPPRPVQRAGAHGSSPSIVPFQRRSQSPVRDAAARANPSSWSSTVLAPSTAGDQQRLPSEDDVGRPAG